MKATRSRRAVLAAIIATAISVGVTTEASAGSSYLRCGDSYQFAGNWTYGSTQNSDGTCGNIGMSGYMWSGPVHAWTGVSYYGTWPACYVRDYSGMITASRHYYKYNNSYYTSRQIAV